MHGPPPKNPATRQRTNRTTTAATFETTESMGGLPGLGRHPVRGRRWNARTRAFWRELWASPMRAEYLRADLDGLVQLATLVDEFWRNPTPQIAAEVRLQRQCYGLTPIDRRRLQWEIVRARDAEDKHPPKRKAPELPVGDPRAALRAV